MSVAESNERKGTKLQAPTDILKCLMYIRMNPCPMDGLTCRLTNSMNSWLDDMLMAEKDNKNYNKTNIYDKLL